MAHRRKTEQHARFKTVQALDEPDDVVRIEQNLGGEKLQARRALRPDPLGLARAAGDGNASEQTRVAGPVQQLRRFSTLGPGYWTLDDSPPTRIRC